MQLEPNLHPLSAINGKQISGQDISGTSFELLGQQYLWWPCSITINTSSGHINRKFYHRSSHQLSLTGVCPPSGVTLQGISEDVQTSITVQRLYDAKDKIIIGKAELDRSILAGQLIASLIPRAGCLRNDMEKTKGRMHGKTCPDHEQIRLKNEN